MLRELRRPSINMAPSPLSKSIMNDRWDEAIGIARSQPDKAKIWGMRQGFFEGLKDSTVLPLHECLVANGPVELVQALIYAYPKGVQQKESSYQRLPLHCACRKNANPKVIQLLLEADSEAALVADSLGRLPLHYALSNGANDEVITLLLKYHANSARGCDNRGWTPLHVACGMGASTHVVSMILNSYPEACILKTRKGSRPVKCVNPKAANKEEVKALLQMRKKEVDANYRPAAPVRQGSERTLV